MYEHQQCTLWDRTASITAVIQNLLRGKDDPIVMPFHPFRDFEQPQQTNGKRRLPFQHIKEVLENGNRRSN